MEFEQIKSYLLSRGWLMIIQDDSICFAKPVESEIITYKVKRLAKLSDVKEIVEQICLKRKLIDLSTKSILGYSADTDYISAAVQNLVNKNNEDIKNCKQIYYAFQPVYRQKNKERCGVSSGYSSIFINVATLGVGINFDDYIEELENWITTFSKCSIHVSRIKLKYKNRINKFSGSGLKIYVDDIEIGQANLLSIGSDIEKRYLFDFGFGLERMCWLMNRQKHYFLLTMSSTAYLLGKKDITDKINIVIAHLLSNVEEDQSKYGLHMKRVMYQIAEQDYNLLDRYLLLSQYKIYKEYFDYQGDFEKLYFDYSSMFHNQLKKLLAKKYSLNVDKKHLKKDIDNFSDFLIESIDHVAE